LGATADPPQKVQSQFFDAKMSFVSIMVTNPNFGCLHFVFSKLPRAKSKMDIFKCPKKCPKIGVKIPRPFLPSAILNEIFLTEMSLKHDLANAQNPKLLGFERNIFG
jgi:hypothetical protein